MFSFFKKKSTIPSAKELEAIADEALQKTMQKWIDFNGKINLKGENQLAEKIDLFSQAIRVFYENHYPIMLIGPAEMFWNTIFTAILESGTHTSDEVNQAIDILHERFSS